MADLFINQGTVDRNAVYDVPRLDPNVVRDVNKGGVGTGELVASLDKFLEGAHRQLDKQTVRRAQEAGSMAGLGPNFKPADGDSLAAEAYNRAGSEIFLNKKVADVSTSIHKMSLDPKLANDPKKLQMSLADLKGQLTKDIPMSLIPQFDVAFNERTNRAVQGAMSRQQELAKSADAAQFLQTESVLVAEATNAARAGDEAALNQSREEYFSSINRRIGYSMSPEEGARKKIAFGKQIQKDAVIGDFLRTPPDKRAAFASKFIEENPLADIMSTDEIDGLKRDMISAWQVDDNLLDAAEAETKEIETKAKENALGTFMLSPTPTAYADYIKLPGVEPKEAAAAKAYLAQNIDQPDPVVDFNITQAIRGGRYTEARALLAMPENYNALPRERVQEHLKVIEEMKNGAGFEKTEAYQEVQRRIRTEYAATSIYGQFNSATGETIQQQIYDELRVKYPKFLRGEIPPEDVDPIRMYNLKKSNLRKTETGDTNGGAEIVTSTQGTVIIPQKYIDDPEQFAKDSKLGLGPALSTPEVESFMAEKIIAKEKEKAATP